MRVREAAIGLLDSEDEDQLKQLDGSLGSPSVVEPEDLDALFRMFERHPDSDGFGVFWSALHWLEAQPAHEYERALIASVQRRPVSFTLNMVNRMLNAGLGYAAGISLLELLRAVATSSDAPPSISAEASEILLRHTINLGQSA